MYLFMASLVVADFYQKTVEAQKCFDNGSICFELLRGMPAAFVALVIGLIAAGITWRQYRVAQAKLKLDLFEKRYAIFKQTEDWLASAMRASESSSDPLPNVSATFFGEAMFLFDADIGAYIEEITTKWNALVEIPYVETDRRVNPTLDNKEQALIQWFMLELSGGAKRKFAPYLSFSKWK
jgi:hypothetical protein